MKYTLALTLALCASPSVALAQSAPLQAPWEPARPTPTAYFFDPPAPTQSRAGRVGYEILGGFAGALGGNLLALTMQCELTPSQCPDSRRDVEEFYVVTAAMSLVAVPLGVTIAGNLANGDGGYGWAFLGSFAGMSVAVPLTVFMLDGASSTRTARYVGIASLLTLLPMAGSIIAYELSSSAPRAPQLSRARVFPAVDVRRDGASAGATLVF